MRSTHKFPSSLKTNLVPRARFSFGQHQVRCPFRWTRATKALGTRLPKSKKKPSSSKQLSTVAAVDSRFGLYHVAVVLSFLRSISLALSYSNNNNNNNNNNNFEEGAIKLKTGYSLAPQDHGLVSALKIINN